MKGKYELGDIVKLHDGRTMHLVHAFIAPKNAGGYDEEDRWLVYDAIEIEKFREDGYDAKNFETIRYDEIESKN
jgi:hypothetical protein